MLFFAPKRTINAVFQSYLQKGKKECKKELTKGRKADNIYQVVSRTHQTISNLVRFVEKIEKKVLTSE